MSFEEAIKFTLVAEGGGNWDPSGFSRWGIDKRSNPDVDLDNLDEEGAKKLYRERYWEAFSCDHMPKACGIVFFECVVNPGFGNMQKVKAVKFHDWRALLLARIKFYQLYSRREYRNGLIGRSIRLLDYVTALIKCTHINCQEEGIVFHGPEFGWLCEAHSRDLNRVIPPLVRAVKLVSPKV